MRTIHRDIVGAAIISKDDKVLLGKTAPADVGVYSGSWVVPGGGIEDDETKLEALQREMLEETRIDISAYVAEPVRTASGISQKKLKTNQEIVNVDMTFFDFKVHIFDKTSKQLGNTPTEELQTLQWFARDELANIDLSEPTEALLRHIKFHE